MDHLTTNNTQRNSELIDVRYGYFTIFATVIFFQIVNKILEFFGPPKIIKPGLEFWRWRNLLCSWSHALISGSIVLYSVLAHPELFDDMVGFITPLSYFVVALSSGYFIYDTIDMYRVGELMNNWEVVVHHIVVDTMFIYNTIIGECIGYNLLAMLSEVSSFFLHTRKLMQMLRVDFNNWFYRLNNIINIVVFAIFRGVGLVAIYWGMSQASERARVSYLYILLLAPATFVMSVINPVLLVRLIKNDIIRPYRRRHADKSNNNMNGHSNGLHKNGHVRNKTVFSLTEKDD